MFTWTLCPLCMQSVYRRIWTWTIRSWWDFQQIVVWHSSTKGARSFQHCIILSYTFPDFLYSSIILVKLSLKFEMLKTQTGFQTKLLWTRTSVGHKWCWEDGLASLRESLIWSNFVFDKLLVYWPHTDKTLLVQLSPVSSVHKWDCEKVRLVFTKVLM